MEIPTTWILRDAAEWAAATGDPAIELEYRILGNVLAQADRQFHRTLIRQLRLVAHAGEDVVLQTLRLVQELEPGCADGRPLRALALAGIDSKFFERNRALIQQLLDARFEDQASERGIESFLGALDEGDHWLLIAPLEPALLPFARQAVPAAELMSTGLPGTHLLVVENERSLHQLPQLPPTVAVLGSGLNLAWMRAPWLKSKIIAYWGDIDTWGLTMLATAHAQQPYLQPLLMDSATFEIYQALAVPEPNPAGDSALPTLSDGCIATSEVFRKGGLSRNFYRARRSPTQFVIGTKTNLDIHLLRLRLEADRTERVSPRGIQQDDCGEPAMVWASAPNTLHRTRVCRLLTGPGQCVAPIVDRIYNLGSFL